MLDLFSQAKHLLPTRFTRGRHARATLMLGIALLLVACATSTSPTPNQLTSTDSMGEIVVRYPDEWTDFVEGLPNAERQGVTLVRAERSFLTGLVDLASLPVVRLSYDRRSDTPLKENQPLAEYALRLVSEQMPTVAFEPPQLRQIGSCAAVTLQGSDPSSSLQYVYTLVDYISEDGVLTAVLTAPDNISPYVDAYELMLANIELTIRSVPPTTTPLPESTLQVTSDAATADVTVEAGTDEAENGTAVTQVTPIAPESSAEAQPQSTLRPEATAELTPSPEAGNVTAEPTTQGAQASTTLTASDTGMFVIGRGIEVLKPEGWEASTNGQTNATLTLGEEVGNALLGNDVLPAGEALISVEIGTVEEVFRQPFGGFDLERWLTNELGRLVADDDSAQAGVIESVVLDETELGLGALISTSKYDRYMIVGQIGTSLYKRVQLYTAPGAFTAYQPILLQITDSIEPAQR